MTAPSQTPEAAELEPCPFCGGAPGIRQAMGETWVVCGSCSASTQSKGRESVAIDLWNRRVTAASAQAAIDAEKAKVAELERRLMLSVETGTDLLARYEAMTDRADAEKARADRLAKALDALQDLFAREGECSMDRFERIAEMFRKDTGYLAPGKDPGMLSQQPDGDELRRIYDDWYAGKIKAARTALQQETQK